MPTLYTVPLDDGQVVSLDETVAAAVETSGLLQQSGVATERISTDTVDAVVSGQFRVGELFSEKLADELSSLTESQYGAVPLFSPQTSGIDRKDGYYSVKSSDVSQAAARRPDVIEYDVALSFTGTTETHWRAIKTRPESIQTGLATDGPGQIAIPATAQKVRWFDTAQGRVAASADKTVVTEFGGVSLFSPNDAPFDDPTLLYEVPFSDEAPIDVRVFDTRGINRFFEAERPASGGDYNTGDYNTGDYGGAPTEQVNQWTHVFHGSFEFEGLPLITNGRFGLRFDEDAGTIDRQTVDNKFISVNLDDFELVDVDLETITPVDVQCFVEFEDTTDGSTEAVILSVQRGLPKAVAREPDNHDPSAKLENTIDAITTNQTTDAQPAQTLISRNEVK